MCRALAQWRCPLGCGGKVVGGPEPFRVRGDCADPSCSNFDHGYLLNLPINMIAHYNLQCETEGCPLNPLTDSPANAVLNSLASNDEQVISQTFEENFDELLADGQMVDLRYTAEWMLPVEVGKGEDLDSEHDGSADEAVVEDEEMGEVGDANEPDEADVASGAENAHADD